MSNKISIRQLWGDYLYNRLRKWIDKDGYITSNWASIVENNFRDWDKDYNDVDDKKEMFIRMYNVDFEDHPETDELIRPLKQYEKNI